MPAAAEQISGDFYLVAAGPQDSTVLVVGDVVGHGVEAARLGIANYYHAVPELSLSYLYGFSLVLLFLGLALQVRHRRRLATL